MNEMKSKSIAVFVVILAVFWSIDRATKLFALAYLPPQIHGFHPFIVYRNYGIAFGILKDNPSVVIFLTLLGTGLLFFAIARYREALLTPWGALLLAGVLGNLADRLIYGYVIDWIHVVYYINLADIWLCVGVLMSLKHFSRYVK